MLSGERDTNIPVQGTNEVPINEKMSLEEKGGLTSWKLLYNFAQNADATRPALPLLWWLGPLAAILALVFAYYFYRQVMNESEGTERMIEIAQAVRDGASAYLTRQYRVVAIVFIALFVLFLIMSFLGLQNPIVPFAFLTGGSFLGLVWLSLA